MSIAFAVCLHVVIQFALTRHPPSGLPSRATIA
jgi:hypothetical protein